MTTHLLAVEDLDPALVRSLLRRAHELAAGSPARRAPHTSLLFLSPSLRTRTGFAAAVARLGGVAHTVSEPRDGAAMSDPESFTDTLRVLSGTSDLVVVRVPFALQRDEVTSWAACPVVNGGDAALGHPTQALADLFALHSTGLPLRDTHLVVCGDVTMRAARSLLQLLEWFPPRQLTVVAPSARQLPDGALGPVLSGRTGLLDSLDALAPAGVGTGADSTVLYQVGLPPGGQGPGFLDADARARFALDVARLEALGVHAVLSPLPLVDEVDGAVRRDPRFTAFRDSDRAVWVRMAVLEHLARSRP